MKIIKLLLLLIIVTSSSFSQGFNYQKYSYSYGFSFWSRSFYVQSKQIKDKKVKEIKTYKLIDGKEVLTEEKQLDTSSKIVYLAMNLDKKKPTIFTTVKINNRVITNKLYPKTSFTTVMRYKKGDSNRKFLMEEMSLFNSRKLSTNKIYRTKEGNVDSVYWFSKNRNYANKKYYYSYENDKLSEIKEFDRKNRLKSIQKFDCNPIGEKIKKVKQYGECVNSEFDKNGNKVKVFVYATTKGQLSKTRVTYKGDSKKITKIERFDSKNRLVNVFSKTDNKSTDVNYNRRGKERAKTIKYFENDRISKTEFFYKNKFQNSLLYEFNSKGLISKSIKTDKKNRQSIFVYAYKYSN